MTQTMIGMMKSMTRQHSNRSFTTIHYKVGKNIIVWIFVQVYRMCCLKGGPDTTKIKPAVNETREDIMPNVESHENSEVGVEEKTKELWIN